VMIIITMSRDKLRYLNYTIQCKKKHGIINYITNIPEFRRECSIKANALLKNKKINMSKLFNVWHPHCAVCLYINKCYSFIYFVVCLTTGPQPLPKEVSQTVRSSVFSFSSQKFTQLLLLLINMLSHYF